MEEEIKVRMLKIYVCSPVKGDVVNNKLKAIEHAKDIARAGHFPVCVHDFLERITGFIGETNIMENDRERLLFMALPHRALKKDDNTY